MSYYTLHTQLFLQPQLYLTDDTYNLLYEHRMLHAQLFPWLQREPYGIQGVTDKPTYSCTHVHYGYYTEADISMFISLKLRTHLHALRFNRSQKYDMPMHLLKNIQESVVSNGDHHVHSFEFSVSSINITENKVDRNVSVFAVHFVGFVRS